MTYVVGRHPKVEQQIERFRKTGAQAQMKTLLERIRDVLATNPCDEHYRLRDELRCVQRLKLGRFRLFFIYSTPLQRVSVLYIGFRKEGDTADAYEEFGRLLKRGYFDNMFAELGLSRDA
ncbi:MAG: Toxin with endonuclease, of toxin-antitoxin system [Pseudomonadota bacterium]